MTTQFGASLTDNFRVVIYDCNMFIIQAPVQIFAGKARSLPYRGIALRHLNRLRSVFFSNIWGRMERLEIENAEAYSNSLTVEKKGFIALGHSVFSTCHNILLSVFLVNVLAPFEGMSDNPN